MEIANNERLYQLLRFLIVTSLPQLHVKSTYVQNKVLSGYKKSRTDPKALPPSLIVMEAAIPELGCYIIHSVAYPTQVIALTPSGTSALDPLQAFP